jgi:hypothetical protein
MRESQHKPTVEIGNCQKAAELYWGGWGWPIPNELDLGWIHMHPSLINNVSQILILVLAMSLLHCLAVTKEMA